MDEYPLLRIDSLKETFREVCFYAKIFFMHNSLSDLVKALKKSDSNTSASSPGAFGAGSSVTS